MNTFICLLTIVCQMVGLGFLSLRFIDRELNLWVKLAVAISMATLGFGVEILLLGYTVGFSKEATIVSSIAVLALSSKVIHRESHCVASLVLEALAVYRESSAVDRIAAVIVVLTFVALSFNSALPIWAGDELEYHWAAPVYWAQHHYWCAAPYKLVNGPALMEWLYTWSAVWSSPTCAHLTHLGVVAAGISAVAGIAKETKLNVFGAASSVLSLPVLILQASTAMNDGAMASYMLVGTSVFLASKFPPKPNRLLLTGLIFAEAFLSKSLGAAVTLVAAASLVIFVHGLRRKLYLLFLVLLPTVIAFVLGTFHTKILTGEFVDVSRKPFIGTIPAKPDYDRAIYIARDPRDPMLLDGCAAGRIPTIRDILTLPFTPILTSVLGQNEPWGGRTGLLIAFFIPLFALFAARRTDPALTHPLILFFWLGAFTFLVTGPFFIKTRFHIFEWSLLSICAFGALTIAKRRWTKFSNALSCIFLLIILLQILDGGRSLLKGETVSYASKENDRLRQILK